MSLIEHKLPRVAAKARTHLGENRFHSGGHNALIRKGTGDYYLCASTDMLYPINLVSKLVQQMEKPEHRSFGSATVKLLHWDEIWGRETDIIDSCGIGLTRAHKFFDVGGGAVDKGQHDSVSEIFGPSGALAFYRRSALEDVKYQNEYFDELLHYKNDVDLAYRLQWAGYKSLLLPGMICYHARGLGKNRTRRRRSEFERENSLLGQLAVVYKNLSKDFSPAIKRATHWRQTLVKAYISIFEREALEGLEHFKEHLPEFAEKRAAINCRVPASEIEKLMR